MLVSGLPKWVWLRRAYCECCCHFVCRNIFIFNFKSVYVTLNLLEAKSRVNFATKSALSFLLTSMGLGIQHIRVSLELNLKSNLLSSLMIKGSSLFCDIKTESEYENIIKFLWLLSEIISSAWSIAWASTEKKELYFVRSFLIIFLSKIAMHTVLSLSLEPSVKM